MSMGKQYRDEEKIASRGPTVTVIMACWNGEDFLRDSVGSVLAQTFGDFELLVIDDCSTDGSWEILSAIASQDARVRLLRTAHNGGPAGARNLGLANARGEYVAFLDCDDVWAPSKLERQLSFMKANGYRFSYTEYQILGRPGSVITGPRVVTQRKMKNYCYPGCLTVMYERALIPDLEVDSSLRSRNDYAMWLKIVRRADCHLLPEVLAQYRIHEGSVSHSGLSKLMAAQYRMWRVSEGNGPLASAIHVARNMVYGTLKKVFYRRKSANSPTDRARD